MRSNCWSQKKLKVIRDISERVLSTHYDFCESTIMYLFLIWTIRVFGLWLCLVCKNCCLWHVCSAVTGQRQTLTIGRSAHFSFQEIVHVKRILHLLRSFQRSYCMFLRISLNSCPLNMLVVQNHQAEIMIVKRLIQRRNNVTRVQVEPRSCDHGRCKNDAFTLSATLPICMLDTSNKLRVRLVNEKAYILKEANRLIFFFQVFILILKSVSLSQLFVPHCLELFIDV